MLDQSGHKNSVSLTKMTVKSGCMPGRMIKYDLTLLKYMNITLLHDTSMCMHETD